MGLGEMSEAQNECFSDVFTIEDMKAGEFMAVNMIHIPPFLEDACAYLKAS